MTIPALRRLAKKFRPPRRLVLLPQGKVFLLVSFGVGLAAVNTGNNLLYLVASLSLALVVVSGLLSERVLKNLAVSIEPLSDAFADWPLHLVASVVAPAGILTAAVVTVSFECGGSGTTSVPLQTRSGERVTTAVTMTAPGRGLHRITGVRVSTRFPFSLFDKTALLYGDEPELVVAPAPSGGFLIDDRSTSGGGDVAARGVGGGAWPKGVRDHTPSDPVRDIHWKATARSGKTMAREWEAEGIPPAELRIPPAHGPAEFESALSKICADLLRAERARRPWRLVDAEGTTVAASNDEAGRSRALRFLASVRFAGGTTA